ncbi:hypothetical protein CSUI_009769, partial [Cystoisospora suis]
MEERRRRRTQTDTEREDEEEEEGKKEEKCIDTEKQDEEKKKRSERQEGLGEGYLKDRNSSASFSFLSRMRSHEGGEEEEEETFHENREEEEEDFSSHLPLDAVCHVEPHSASYLSSSSSRLSSSSSSPSRVVNIENEASSDSSVSQLPRSLPPSSLQEFRERTPQSSSSYRHRSSCLSSSSSSPLQRSPHTNVDLLSSSPFQSSVFSPCAVHAAPFFSSLFNSPKENLVTEKEEEKEKRNSSPSLSSQGMKTGNLALLQHPPRSSSSSPSPPNHISPEFMKEQLRMCLSTSSVMEKRPVALASSFSFSPSEQLRPQTSTKKSSSLLPSSPHEHLESNAGSKEREEEEDDHHERRTGFSSLQDKKEEEKEREERRDEEVAEEDEDEEKKKRECGDKLSILKKEEEKEDDTKEERRRDPSPASSSSRVFPLLPRSHADLSSSSSSSSFAPPSPPLSQYVTAIGTEEIFYSPGQLTRTFSPSSPSPTPIPTYSRLSSSSS